MRRVLLCLLTFPCALNLALAQTSAPTMQNQSHQSPPTPQSQQQIQQQLHPTCGSTFHPDPTNPYVILKGGPTASGATQYRGQLRTHLPNGNPVCNIRQIYFELPQHIQSPVIQTILIYHHGKIVGLPIDYDTQDAGPNGNLFLYVTNAQAPQNMTGNYDLLVTVTGKLTSGNNK